MKARKRLFKKAKLYWRTLGPKGLYAAVKAGLNGKVIRYRVSRKDCKYPFILRVPLSDVTAYRQVFFDREYDFEVNSPPDFIVDAGANVGMSAIHFANRFPEAKIIAIEAEGRNFELLKENIKAYSNVTAIHAALWNANEIISLVDPGLGEWGFITRNSDERSAENDKGLHAVQGITMDKLIEDYDLGRIDILKMDIEGAEKEVFANSSSWIGRVDSLVVELHEHMKSGCHRAFYSGTPGFANEWQQGENIYLSKGGCILPPIQS